MSAATCLLYNKQSYFQIIFSFGLCIVYEVLQLQDILNIKYNIFKELKNTLGVSFSMLMLQHASAKVSMFMVIDYINFNI